MTIHVTCTQRRAARIRPKPNTVIAEINQSEFVVRFECFSRLKLTMPDGSVRDIVDGELNTVFELRLTQYGEVHLVPAD